VSIERGSDSSTPEGVHYLLGHSEHELRRLDVQGHLFRGVSERGFRAAGLAPGMRVLDLGCGTGDVSMLVAELVGPTGHVVGIDRGETAVNAATSRAAARGVANVEFRVCEIDAFHEPDGFDALVGRFILMHQSDPASVLRSAARSVRSGGIVCILESYMDVLMSGPHSFPNSELYAEVVRWKGEVVGGAGADVESGGRLHPTFIEAGLAAPTTRMEAALEGGPDSAYYEYLALSLESMLPEAERQGVGGYTLDDALTIGDRLRDDMIESNGTLMVWPVVAAWSRIA